MPAILREATYSYRQLGKGKRNHRRRWSLGPDSRQKVVNKITETLQKHMPPTDPEGANDLKRIALRFEEKMYNAAADQQDYLRRISLKMLSLETRSQVPGWDAQVTGSSGRETKITEGGGFAPIPDRRWSLHPDSRQKMVDKIMEKLQKHMPPTSPEGMNELKTIALLFEERIYNAVADQQDYLRKISLKMLSLETRSQVPGGNAQCNSQKPLDHGENTN